MPGRTPQPKHHLHTASDAALTCTQCRHGQRSSVALSTRTRTTHMPVNNAVGTRQLRKRRCPPAETPRTSPVIQSVKQPKQCTAVSVSAVQPSPAHRGGHTAPAPPHPHPSRPFVRHGGQTGTQSPRQQPLRHCSVPLHCTAPFLHTPGSESAAGPSYRSSRRAMAGAGGGSIKTFSTDLRETTPNTFQ